MVSPIGAAISIEGRRGIPLELVGEFRRGQLRDVHRPCRMRLRKVAGCHPPGIPDTSARTRCSDEEHIVVVSEP
jgi:hypothetical protein